MERFLKGICTIILSLLLVTIGLTGVYAEGSSETPEIEAVVNNATSSTDSMNIVYQSNIENYGWQNAITTNGIAGLPSGQALNAFAISIPNSIGSIKVRSHIENVGWQSFSYGVALTGNPNSGKKMQAIQMELADGAQDKYDLYYHVNVNNIGWLDWAKNGETAGIVGLDSYYITQIQVTFTAKNEPAPGSTECSALEAAKLQQFANITYSAHVSKQGWQSPVSDGAVAGSTGLGLSIEAMQMSLPDAAKLGDNSNIAYTLQCQNVGWTPVVEGGETAGTVGQSLNAEAASINLTGRAAAVYDVYYRAHSAFYGWLGWAKNGEPAGTIGISTPLEAIQVQLVLKNSPAPGDTNRTAITQEYLQSRANVEYQTYVQNLGWTDTASNGADAGAPGQALQIESFAINMPNKMPDSSITYQAHVSDIGWMNPVSNGTPTGTINEGKAVQAFTISLSGEDSYSYDVYYQAYCENFGWLGWAKNGEWAGTTGGGLRVEGMRVMLLPRGSNPPGPTDNAYIAIEPPAENWLWPIPGSSTITSTFGARWGTTHLGIDVGAKLGEPIIASKSGTVIVAGNYFGYGICVVIRNDKTGEDTYYGHLSGLNTAVGAHVQQGQIIGFAGSTGNSTGVHLHFGIKDHGTWINPLDIF